MRCPLTPAARATSSRRRLANRLQAASRCFRSRNRMAKGQGQEGGLPQHPDTCPDQKRNSANDDCRKCNTPRSLGSRTPPPLQAERKPESTEDDPGAEPKWPALPPDPGRADTGTRCRAVAGRSASLADKISSGAGRLIAYQRIGTRHRKLHVADRAQAIVRAREAGLGRRGGRRIVAASLSSSAGFTMAPVPAC
jgi:hypothetical protein